MEQNISTTQTGVSEAPDTQVLAKLWQAMRRRKLRIMLGVAIGLALGVLFAILTGPWLESIAEILVVKKRLDTAPISGPNEAQHQDDYLATHMLIITSPRIIDRAITEGNLSALPCYQDKFKDDIEFRKHIIDSLVVTRDAPRPGLLPSNEILTVAFRGRDGDACATVLTAVIASYEEFLKDLSRNVNSEILDLVTRARDILKKDVEAQEAAYEEFRKQTPPLWKGKEGSTLQQERLFSLDAKRSTLRMRQAEIQASLTEIRAAQNKGGSAAQLLAMLSGPPSNRELLASALLTTAEPWNAGRPARATLEEELYNLQLQEGKLLEKYGVDHPEVQASRRRLEAVRGMIIPSSAAESKTPDQMDLVNLKIQLLEQELNEIKRSEQSFAELFDRDQQEAKTALLHEAQDENHRESIKRSQVLYDSVVKRLQEVNVAKEYGGFETRVIGLPESGEWVIKKILLVAGLALFVGLMGGFGWAYLGEVSDRTFRTPKEIRRDLGLSVIGHIPLFTSADEAGFKPRSLSAPLAPSLRAYYESSSREAEAYRALRTALCFNSGFEQCKVIQITSPDSGDGKSTLAANLAISIAQSGKRVVLIDADLRNPRLNQLFALSNTAGLTSLLSGQSELPAASQPTGVPGLDLIAGGPASSNPAELLSSPGLGEVLESLRQQYDVVLVDTPPLLTVTDPCVVASHVDGVLLTLRISAHSKPHAQRARELLEPLGVRVLGVVVNGVPDHSWFAGSAYESYPAAVVS